MVDLPDAAEWMPAEIPERMHPKISAQWWTENPPGCHLFTAAYAQRYRLVSQFESLSRSIFMIIHCWSIIDQRMKCG